MNDNTTTTSTNTNNNLILVIEIFISLFLSKIRLPQKIVFFKIKMNRVFN